MARRKKINQKPATSSKVNESLLAQEACEGEMTGLDEEVPVVVEEVFKDTLVDFPEFGGNGPLDSDEGMSGVKRNGVKWSDQADVESDFQSQAKDKWAQFWALLPNQGGARLNFEEPLIRESQRIAQVDLEEIEVETSFWNSAVVCMVLGANPPFTVFEGFIKRIWGKLGIERITRLNAGYTLVKFRDEATKDLVLEAGVLHFDRKPVIVKPWSADLDTLRSVRYVHVWVRLPGLGLQYWGTKCLSALVSTIGNLILVDKVTKDRSMMQFARVLVEVEITEEVPQSIQFLNERGQLMEQLLEFEWLPTQCKRCRVYGHTETLCNRKQGEVWRKKVRNVDERSKQKPTELNSLAEITALASEVIADDKRKVDAKEKSESHAISEPPGKVKGLDSKVSKQTEAKASSESRERLHSDWITPKRVGGVKSLAPNTQNKLKNSYSALQDKIMEEVGSNKKFCVTFVYGRNSIKERLQLWLDLAGLSFPANPWLVAGDFNAVFEFNDRLGGRDVTALEMVDAQRWRSLGLVDEMRTSGSHYTWTYKQANEARIYSKLDRIFKNEAWLDLFPQAEAYVNWEMLSDHCFCIIKPGATLNFGIKPFRFFNMWTNHEDFREIVLQSWSKPIKVHGLERIMRKLMRLKHVLRKFNRRTIGDVVHNYTVAKKNYQAAQNQLQQDPHSAVLQREERLACQLNEKFEDVVAHFVNHFRSIMGSKSTASVPIQRTCFSHGNILSLDQQLSLIKPFTKKEVEAALFSINPIKSPGPDGYGSSFFKAMWKDVGEEIFDAILDFFIMIDTPTKAVEYRPIACCNTLYKCISKMLCGRLTKALPILVNQNQGAFVKDRLLAHNILILQDIIKGYKRKNISPRCVMKIDLSKAYDTIDWQFLEDILTTLCFPNKFIRWVMICLKGTSYSILMYGRIQGSFRGKKGLRQGDPVSPLLFLLVMEYFTRVLIQASLNKKFRFHPKCKNLKLVNLCFADDLVIFCKGVNNSVQIIKECFTTFSLASGLSANLDKSQVYFGGLAETETKQILNRLQFVEGSFPLKYLGVPLRTTKWKAGDCAAIIKKIHLKLHTRSSRHLSFAGRAQLFNSVLLGSRSFWMSIFLLPKSFVKEIDHLCRIFLWGTNDSSRNRSKMYLTAWEQVCLPKSLSGIGFKEGSKWNKVLLAKFVWALSSKQDILWVKWVDSIYLKGQNFWEYKMKQDASWYWRKLTNLRSVFSYKNLEEAAKNSKVNLRKLYFQMLNKDRVHYANVESHSHLFFYCQFSQQVRANVAAWLGVDIWPSRYEEWISWMVGKPKVLKQKLAAAALAASVYLICWNRNMCMFRSCSMTVGNVDHLIKFYLKAILVRLPKLKVKKNDLAFVEQFVQI
ncbi:uncharacterized protein LOC133825275 [Humulus lupulus]|uniref:uncharacterized protein LOC133825275 n=1 Tax=Humulus lupulus TaxID=3486 RepID=UPI002B412AED|nr:uncharacterized protein LOC133825275 [Humulus lupulus]